VCFAILAVPIQQLTSIHFISKDSFIKVRFAILATNNQYSLQLLNIYINILKIYFAIIAEPTAFQYLLSRHNN
jgi:hypothetical protein